MVRIPWRGVGEAARRAKEDEVEPTVKECREWAATLKRTAPKLPVRKGEVKGAAAQRAPEPPIRRAEKIGEGSGG